MHLDAVFGKDAGPVGLFLAWAAGRAPVCRGCWLESFRALHAILFELRLGFPLFPERGSSPENTGGPFPPVPPSVLIF